ADQDGHVDRYLCGGRVRHEQVAAAVGELVFGQTLDAGDLLGLDRALVALRRGESGYRTKQEAGQSEPADRLHAVHFKNSFKPTGKRRRRYSPNGSIVWRAGNPTKAVRHGEPGGPKSLAGPKGMARWQGDQKVQLSCRKART